MAAHVDRVVADGHRVGAIEVTSDPDGIVLWLMDGVDVECHGRVAANFWEVSTVGDEDRHGAIGRDVSVDGLDRSVDVVEVGAPREHAVGVEIDQCEPGAIVTADGGAAVSDDQDVGWGDVQGAGRPRHVSSKVPNRAGGWVHFGEVEALRAVNRSELAADEQSVVREFDGSNRPTNFCAEAGLNFARGDVDERQRIVGVSIDRAESSSEEDGVGA